MVVLPLTYWGNIEHFANLLQGGEEAIIDLGENYVKRSERNRTEIMTSGGIMQLSVQLCHANKPRQAMRSMRIDYSKRWQHQHHIAMMSAYRSSPYYDHYAYRFEELYSRHWEWLTELNLATLESVCNILKVSTPRLSEQYITASNEDLDMRQKQRGSTFVAEPYYQVFSERMPFEPNLSILDLLMCEGPSAIDAVLMRCRL